MGAHDKLDAGKGGAKLTEDGLLPVGVQVHIHFVYQYNAFGLLRRVFTHLRVELNTAEGNVGRQRYHSADAVA